VPPGPEARYGVHFLSSGPGVTPLLSPLAPTLGVTTNIQMKCPHCNIDFHDKIVTTELGRDPDGFWCLDARRCAACNRLVIEIVQKGAVSLGALAEGAYPGKKVRRYLVRPKSASRPNPSRHVPEDFAADYREAALILADSPKSSAALSRRCLQHVLRDKACVKKSDLSREIE
jgi:phage FluMu protein Com